MAVVTDEDAIIFAGRINQQFDTTMEVNKNEAKLLLQLLEDWYINGFSTQPTESLNSAINAASGGLGTTFKKRAVRAWCLFRSEADF